jgi:lipoyl(octanoyl) transferase
VTSRARLIRPSGLVDYDAANASMHELAEQRLDGVGADALVLLEHPPVFTAGRRAKDSELLASEPELAAAGAAVRWIDRGGSFTFHGPGQLVGYAVLDLGARPDALRFVRSLEEVVIRASGDAGVALQRSDVQTGVWSVPEGRLERPRKVCAIGVRLMRMRVSLHGFALNCTTDLSWYDAIVPCGLPEEGVTSLTELAGREITVDDMAPLVARRFEEVFDRRLEPQEDTWPSRRASEAPRSTAGASAS